MSGSESRSTALLADDSDVVCPFCGECDFDLVGLKMHLLRGWCDKFNETSLDVPRTREANATSAKRFIRPTLLRPSCPNQGGRQREQCFQCPKLDLHAMRWQDG